MTAANGYPTDGAVHAVERFVRDCIERGHRTEARVAERDEALREPDAKPRDAEG
ncbi:DUF2191 domain-containing protein [Streptomyces sp. NPDC051243]|uniref:DUF2191 domain-containing protein n=1 Tax=Streptomyces sp. NPDC051243 TaxID=3365646 RepID=UPI00378C9A42